MAEFKKGQLVAVRNSDEFWWKMFVYDHEEDGRHFCTWPEYEDWGATDWKYVRPAEEVWPNIFLGWERRAREQSDHAVEMESELVQRLRRQIAWLCQELAHSDDLCPTFLMTAPCDHNCPRCWEEASLKAVG